MTKERKLPVILSYENLKKKYSHSNAVISLIEKHKTIIDEISNEMLKVVQKEIIKTPTVSIARSKSPLRDREYFIGKTFFPISADKTIDVRIHLGRAETFNGDTRNPEAFKVARTKMSITLQRRLEEGSL